MDNLLIILFPLYYFIFFVRALTLSKSIGRSIKSKGWIVNVSLIFSGITAITFYSRLVHPAIKEYLFIFYSLNILTIVGLILICIGFCLSTFASWALGKSWRIGVNEEEKTKLITTGIYGKSRNPYFVSYDLVSIGMILFVPSPFIIFPAIITIVMFHLLILKEEKHLKKKHGDEYEEYKKNVPRYI